MATNFKLKRSSVASKRPGLSNLELGELALNTYDGFLFTERNGLGITTVANITPWYENYGAESIFYTNRVGIGTTAVPATNQLLVKGGTETDRLNVTGISTHVGIATFNGATFHDDVTFTGANYNVVWDKAANSLEFPNNAKLAIGSGTDLLIYHDSSNSVIRSGGTGQLQIESSNNTSIAMGNAALSETIFKGIVNGAVDLYYDNVKRFSTSGVGATVFGELDVTGPADIEGNLTVGVGGTTITTVVGAAASVGIGDASPSYMLDVAGAINSQTDVKINGTSVTDQALNDAVAMAIALG